MKRTDLIRITNSLLFAVLVLGATRAQGTSLVRMSLQQLAQASTDIIRGRVVEQESAWNAAHTQIFTVTRIAVEQRIKGQAPQVVDIEQPGGKVQNVRVYVPGTVHFLPSSDYMLFLEGAASTHYLIVGMIQGAYRIYAGSQTGEERVIDPLGSTFDKSLAGAAGTVTLTQFRQALSGAMHASIAIPAGTVLPVIITATEMSGVGRLQVEARTARDAFPTTRSVVPAGSVVAGTAHRESGTWRIRWSDVVVRGISVPIMATSEEPAGAGLQGTTTTVMVRVRSGK